MDKIDLGRGIIVSVVDEFMKLVVEFLKFLKYECVSVESGVVYCNFVILDRKFDGVIIEIIFLKVIKKEGFFFENEKGV